MTDPIENTRLRVNSLPNAVRDCEACGGEDTMKIRRGSLHDGPCAEDTMLKCIECYAVRTHGIPLDRETFEAEMARRGSRIVDAVEDGPDSVAENLEALGYIDY